MFFWKRINKIEEIAATSNRLNCIRDNAQGLINQAVIAILEDLGYRIHDPSEIPFLYRDEKSKSEYNLISTVSYQKKTYEIWKRKGAKEI